MKTKVKLIAGIVLGILLITVIAGTAFAANNDGKVSPPNSDEAYRQMYEACHGPNGYMTKYYEKNGEVPQNFDGMMNGANYDMMNGANYGNMMR
jgi:hypothetical protein